MKLPQHCGLHDGNLFHPDCFGAGFARRRQLPTHAHPQPMPDMNAIPFFQIELGRFAMWKMRIGKIKISGPRDVRVYSAMSYV